MSDSLFYKLGKGSLSEAKKTLSRLIEVGDVGVYLDEDSLETLIVALNELLIDENIRYLKERRGVPGSVKVDFFAAYLKSRRKLVVSDKEVEEASEEELI